MKENYSIKDYLTSPIITKINEEEERVRQAVMREILSTHQPYSIRQSPYQGTLRQMEQKNVLSINDQDEVVSIYPVSAVETNKKVIFEDGSYGYAMCAIDAIGFHYAFQEPVRIEGHCQHCDEKIVLEVKDGKVNVIEGGKDIYILHTDLENNQNWSCSCCNIMHFFSCKESLEQWQAEHVHQTKTFAVNLETANKIAWLLFST